MPSTTPTLQEIREQIVTDIEGEIGQTVPILTKAFVRVLAVAIAGVQWLCYRFGAWLLLQIFTSTSDEAQLYRRGAQYGLAPTGATRAVLEAQATGVNGTTIPVGTLYNSSASGLVYQVTTAVDIAAGVATVEVECLTAGAAGNLDNGEPLTLSSTIAGIDSVATVTDTTTTGENAESVESFRAQVQEREANQPQGGAVPDYVQWQLEVTGIVKAFAHRITAGFATCYPLISLTGTRIPGPAKLEEVRAYLADPIRKPLQSTPLVIAMTEVVFDITITGLDPDTAELRAAIESALATYLLGRYPAQYPDEVAPTDVVSTSALSGVATGAGMASGVLTMDADATPATTYTLSPGELAIIGSMTWA